MGNLKLSTKKVIKIKKQQKIIQLIHYFKTTTKSHHKRFEGNLKKKYIKKLKISHLNKLKVTKLLKIKTIKTTKNQVTNFIENNK